MKEEDAYTAGQTLFLSSTALNHVCNLIQYNSPSALISFQKTRPKYKGFLKFQLQRAISINIGIENSNQTKESLHIATLY